MNAWRSPRRLLAEFREDWAAADEALERNRRRRSRKQAQAEPEAPAQTDADAVAIANTATIAGNVANHIVHQ